MIWNSDGSTSGNNTANGSIQHIHDVLAADGDWITIPAGPFHWTELINITKSITLSGLTTISGTYDTSMTADDQTIILDDVPKDGDGNARLIQIVGAAGKKVRVTGITLRVGSRTSSAEVGGIYIIGDSEMVRIDHCHLDRLVMTQFIHVSGGTRGAIHDNIFEDDGSSLSGGAGTSILVLNGKSASGDPTWTEPPGYNSTDFLFIEDNTFHWKGDVNTQNKLGLDCYRGGKYTARRNHFINCKPNTHGTESSQRQRSSRAVAIYDNILTWTTNVAATAGQIRGGGALIYNNAYTNYGSGYGLRVYREFQAFLFGRADGADGWDDNAAADGSSAGAGVAGHVFYSGTHTGANGAAVLVDSGASFPTLTAYVIRNMGQDGATFRFNNYIASNTSTSITLGFATDDFGAPYLWNNNDHYEIRKVRVALDQPGRGQGDLIVGAPTDLPFVISGGPNNGIKAWPRQAPEPIFSWGNTNGGRVDSFGEPTLTEGVDYYNREPQAGDFLYPYTPAAYPHYLRTGGGDIVAPVVTLDSPSGTVSGVITLSATATDDVAMAGVQFRRDGVNNIGAVVSGAGPTFTRTFDTTTVPNGTHTFTATASDTASPPNSAVSNVLTLNIQNTDLTPPTVSITAPLNGAIVSGAAVAVTATASDNVAVLGVVFKCDGVTIGSEDTSAPYSCSMDTTGMTDGAHTITATARDSSLNATSTINVTVQNGAVTPPTGGGKKHKKKNVIGRRR